MSRFTRFGHALYTGRRSISFVGHRRIWYLVAGTIVVAALLVVGFRGLNWGVEFTGGTQYTLSGLTSEQASQSTVDTLRTKLGAANIAGVGDPSVSTAGNSSIDIVVGQLNEDELAQVTDVIKSVVPVSEDQISPSTIGASWGQGVARRAVLGVIIFLALVMLFIGAYFREWKMSAAAFIKLAHDLAITIGIYSLSGFVVSPAAVTGFLAILGFSLYDTVVVFDKIRENTKNLRASKQTYAQAANLAVNQTLVRSINTGIVALIPIGAILWVSAVQLGGSTLQDLALAQFVGMAVGVYSSVFLAPRILVHLKSREKAVIDAERRAKARSRQADKYANVPAFTEDLPVPDRPQELEDLDNLDDVPDLDDEDGVVAETPRRSRQPRPDVRGRGRTAPAPHRPVRESGASGRPQPTRQSRSKRGK